MKLLFILLKTIIHPHLDQFVLRITVHPALIKVTIFRLQVKRQIPYYRPNLHSCVNDQIVNINLVEKFFYVKSIKRIDILF